MSCTEVEVMSSMVEIMRYLKLSDSSITPPLVIATDQGMDGNGSQKKTFNFGAESTTPDFTPPIAIRSSNLMHSTESTLPIKSKLVGTAPEVIRLKSAKDLLKASKAKSATKTQPNGSCTLTFEKVPVRKNTEPEAATPSEPVNSKTTVTQRTVGFGTT